MIDGLNITLPIWKEDGTSFYDIVLRKPVVDSIVMSLSDKITGDFYYKDSDLVFTMREYVTYNDVNYYLVNPPTVVREGLVKDNSDLKGMTKYSVEFYHPMYILSNMPFTDVAVSYDELRYKSQDKTFSWIGKPADFVAKLNKNLDGTEWVVVLSDRFPQDKVDELSEVLSFDNATIGEALKTGYETWNVPYVVDKLYQGEYFHTDANHNNTDYYDEGKRFVVLFGLPSNEIYAQEGDTTPYVFKFGQGLGLKNNSRNPRNNKIITRLAGYGSENNIPYGYPQIRWYGNQDATCTIGDSVGVVENITINGKHYDRIMSYPIYQGIVGGEYVKLIKHPFTRNHLMPSIYSKTVFNKVSQFTVDENGNVIVNEAFNPDIEIIDYYDAVENSDGYDYQNLINTSAPSYEIHEFGDIKPELGEEQILGATPIDAQLNEVEQWDDTMDDNGNYLQSYFKLRLPRLGFDIYACAAITQEMQINMRSGACIGCTFTVQVDWEDYKMNFYDSDMNFAPHGSQRNYERYPDSSQGEISVIVQKDINTFGTLMPNIYQKPASGDLFVVLGISLPLDYITRAESRLDDAMKSYMLENNVYYFDYPFKFDEHFLHTQAYALNQIRPNSIIRFEYNGKTLELFVKQLTIKYGDNVLPQYDITLTDNVDVVLNAIGQVADDVQHIGSLVALLRQSYGKSVWVEIAKKLSKIDDDTANGLITFLKGLRTGQYVHGWLGSGANIDASGNSEFESVYVRGAMRVAELVFNLVSAEEGESIRSIGHGEIESVTPSDVVANRGVAVLKLDGDGLPTISEGDICRGLYNTYGQELNGVYEDEGFDDNGFRKTIGFFASYFRVLSVSLVNGKWQFEYILQSQGSTPLCEHPCPLMKFAVYGNTKKSKVERKSSIYTTAVGIAPRILFLSGVNTWQIQPQNIKIAIGNLNDVVVLEELNSASEYEQSNDPNKFNETIDGVIHYYAHKTLEGDAGFYCEDNIYLGGIINQFKAAALDAITAELGVLGQAWVLPSVDSFVVDCDENGNVEGNQTLDLSAYLYYENEPLAIDRNNSSFSYGSNTYRPTLSESNTKASRSFTFNDGTSISSGSIRIDLVSTQVGGNIYSAIKTISIIANKRGKKGDTGSATRFLGNWVDTLRPVWDGAFRDYVKYSGTYWIVNVYSDGTTDLGEPSIDNKNWENIGFMRSVATELLLAENGTINLLSSNAINLYDGNRKTASINDDGNGSYCIYYPSGNKMMEFSSEGFIYYYNDNSEHTLAWKLGLGGNIDKANTDDWLQTYLCFLPFGENTNVTSSSRFNRTMYWKFKSGSTNAWAQYDGMHYTVNNGNPETNTANIIPDGYYTPNEMPIQMFVSMEDERYAITAYQIQNGKIINTITIFEKT